MTVTFSSDIAATDGTTIATTSDRDAGKSSLSRSIGGSGHPGRPNMAERGGNTHRLGGQNITSQPRFTERNTNGRK